MRTHARGGFIGYWEIYKWLADTLVADGAPAFDSTVQRLRGATEANANRGAMAALIREYTATQYDLRYGQRPSDLDMQVASNAVAENLLKDVLGESEPIWPRRQVPAIERIAFADATAVGEQLFARDSSDTELPAVFRLPRVDG
jgi:serralysin